MKFLVSVAATAAALTLAATVSAAGSPPQNTSAPTIEGTPVVGKTLSAGNGIWLNNPTKFAFQWLRCDAKGNNCVRLSGETDRTYTVATSDVGRTLVVYVTATNANGSAGPVNSKPTDVVTPPQAPKLVAAPKIVGKAQVGEQLVANPGTYAGGAVTKLTFQWQRCDTSGAKCVDAAGATAQSYGVLKADVGKTLRVEVRATNAYGTTVTTTDRTATVMSTPAPEPVRVTTTLDANRSETICCQTVRLTGTVSSGKAGESISVLAHEAGDVLTYPVAQTTSTAGGDWSVTVKPMVETTYMAQTSTSKSSALVVGVHPRVGLGVNGNLFTTKVTARDSFGGRVVLFQTRTRGSSWKTARAIVLDLKSTARFRVPLKRGLTFEVRAYLTDLQAGEGYLDGVSHVRRAGGQA